MLHAMPCLAAGREGEDAVVLHAGQDMRVEGDEEHDADIVVTLEVTSKILGTCACRDVSL